LQLETEADFFTVDFDRASAIGDGLGKMLKRRIAALEHGPDTRRAAAAAIAKSGNRFMDEKVLWLEWRNDLLATPRASVDFERARTDPDRNYLNWIDERTLDPYRVSYRAVDKVADRVGIEKANLLIQVRWQQEIAWAHRLRRSVDDRDAIASNLFLTKSQHDASAEFVKFADAYMEAIDDHSYVTAPEHEYDAEQIRNGFGSDAFVPVYLRRGRVAYASNLERLPAKVVKSTADNMRRLEERELAVRAAKRAAEAARRTQMARLPGMIDVALDVGLDSDGLLAAQERFVDLLEAGTMPVPIGTGLPYHEFLAWLRTTRHVKEQISREVDEVIAESDLLSIVASPVRWVAKLPPDYRLMGGDEPAVFREWVMPLMGKRRKMPRDVVADYGFHLMTRLKTEGRS
jgi:hypothetical protein